VASEEIGGEAQRWASMSSREQRPGVTIIGPSGRSCWRPVCRHEHDPAWRTYDSSGYFGLPPITNPFSPWEVAALNAKMDAGCLPRLPCCLPFCNDRPSLDSGLPECDHGRAYRVSDAMTIGRRIVNQLRLFNFRHGLDPHLEVPSPRYGSAPTDGPAQGNRLSSFSVDEEFLFRTDGVGADDG